MVLSPWFSQILVENKPALKLHIGAASTLPSKSGHQKKNIGTFAPRAAHQGRGSFKKIQIYQFLARRKRLESQLENCPFSDGQSHQGHFFPNKVKDKPFIASRSSLYGALRGSLPKTLASRAFAPLTSIFSHLIDSQDAFFYNEACPYHPSGVGFR
jgi:hypothetical protein